MGRLDHETKSTYLLNVSATAVGVDSQYIPMASVTINVTVLDVNDNAPTFSSGPERMTVNARDLSPDVPIATFRAVDKDAGRNAAISYRMSIRGNGNYFRIDKRTGEVFPIPGLIAGEYLLQIKASDNAVDYPRSTIKNLYLTVLGSMTTTRPTTTTTTPMTTTTTPTTTTGK